MTTGTSEPMTSAPPDAPAKNSFQRIAGVLFAPAETFRDIARKPDFIIPLLLILIVGYIATFVVLPKMDWDAMAAQQAEQMKKQRPNMTEADVERGSAMVKSFGTVAAWIGPLLQLIWYLIVAGVLLLAFRLFGGEGTYGQAFSATLYAWMPMIIGAIVGTIVIALRPGMFDPNDAATLVKSSPAFLVDPKEQAALFAVLSSLDIFTIWTVILLIIGFSKLSRSSIGKSAGIVISLWVVIIVIKVGFAAMRGGMGS